jgi:hypothetical protein
MEYIELWNITTQTIDSSFYMTLLIVGSVWVIFESLTLFSRKQWGENSSIFNFLDSLSHPRYPGSKMFLPIGIIMIISSGVIFTYSHFRLADTAKLLKSDNIEIVEGIVEVEFEQPESGHTGGDIIHIGNKTFEIQYYSSSFYYHQSIAHGGFLKQGESVRISYLPTLEEESSLGDGKILKIEQKNTPYNSE